VTARIAFPAPTGFVLAARRGADVHPLALASMNPKDLDRLVIRRAEPRE
jgi:hypothetical protein